MAITPLEDKLAIKAIIDTDDFIINELGFNPSDVIILNNVDEEVTGTSKKIYIVDYPTPVSTNGLTIRVSYGIEVMTTTSFNGSATRAIAQIMALLDNTDIGNAHTTEIYEGISQLTSSGDTVRYGMVVSFQTSIKTNVK